MGSGLAINGRPVPAQHIRELTVSAETARQSLRGNGFDEVIVHDEKSSKDFLIASSSMDLSALRKNKPAVLTLDGKAVSLVDYDAENNSVVEGAMQGVRNGWKDLGDTTIGAVRTVVGTLGAGGSVAMVGTAVGGSAYFLIKRGAAAGGTASVTAGVKEFMAASSKGLASGGLTAMKVIGIAALAGAAIVTVAGAIRGASDSSNTSHAQNFASLSRISIPRGSNMKPTAESDIKANPSQPIPAPVENNVTPGFTMLRPLYR